MKIAIGADHAGFELKQKIRDHLQSQGFDVLDEGTNSPDSVDYPDYALKVSEDVTGHRADLGILVCGTGIGMSIAANKVPGIRAARGRQRNRRPAQPRAQRRQRAYPGRSRHRHRSGAADRGRVVEDSVSRGPSCAAGRQNQRD